MKVRIKYFARLREAMGRDGEVLELAVTTTTVAGIREHLLAGGGAALAEIRNLRAAVNQTMVGPDAPVADGDEVAFFPPVTGG
ncbi:MAG: molybdopterin converting factor subunit 1 [Rhodocyclaceae bacterium]|nr:molybdopterin converting factor subunit 1 [Rhodocyclaceae bacterium]